jgi:hypothetical protein
MPLHVSPPSGESHFPPASPFDLLKKPHSNYHINNGDGIIAVAVLKITPVA